MKIRILFAVVMAAFLLSACAEKGTDGDIQQPSHSLGHSDATQSQSTAIPENTPDNSGDYQEPQPEPVKMIPEYELLYNQNPDLVGWIEIPGTALSNPVVQSPDRPNYYLHRGFDGEYDYSGTIYVREKCDVNTPSDNVTIYGHNMADGTMFGILHKYKNPDFWQENRLIQFDTLYERHTYEICLVFRTAVNVSGGFDYHLFDTAQNAAAFDDFVSKCRARSLYDTGITPVFGEKLITLSTCDRSIQNGRLVVVARRINE